MIYLLILYESRIPVPIHVDESKVESDLTPDFIESSVSFMMVFDDFSVSSIAEGCVSWVLAIAKFIVTTLIDVEWDWTAPGYSCIACSIAIRIT
jgi:hypothetical protein